MFGLFLLLSRLPKAQRARVAEQLLPFAFPAAPAQRMMIAAFTAERQVQRQAQTEQRLVEEAIKAGGFTAPADLSTFPALNVAFNNLPPAIQAGLFAGTP